MLSRAPENGADSRYDYHTDNYPQTLYVPPAERVVLSLSSSLRYKMQNDSLSDAEWATVLYYAREGRVQLGADRRAFMPVYFHQYHCVRALQRSLLFPHMHDDVNVLKEPDEHVQHCLNYLRQTFLCNPIDQLEPGDYLEKSIEPGTSQGELVCEDWEKAFERMDQLGDEFLAWNDEWN